jgi:uncharacterized membrane protein
MKEATLALLAQESADWRHRGLISQAQWEPLALRYEQKKAAAASLAAWLGKTALFFLGLAILGLVGTMAALWSPGVLIALLAIVAAGCWRGGTWLVTRAARRYPVTGNGLVTLALMAACAALQLLALALKDSAQTARLVSFGAWFVISAIGMATAYAYRLRWPLCLSLLYLFHGLGSWSYYAGEGSYVGDIQDPPTMALLAALMLAWSLWHLRQEEGRWGRYAGFGRLYEIFGLLYLNCALWFLSLDSAFNAAHGLAWVLVFSASCIGQIVLGARFKDARLTGFGVVFLSIDLYTRFFEQFWNRLSLGQFLLVAGAIGLVLGWLCERRAGALAP